MPISSATDFDVVCLCGAVYHASEEHAGRYIKCGCGRRVQIRRTYDARERSPAKPSRPPSPATPSITGSLNKLVRSGRLAVVEGKAVLQRLPLPWKVISALVLCCALVGVSIWAYRSRQMEGKQVPEGYTLDKTTEPRASPEGIRRDDEPTAARTVPESVTPTKPAPAPISAGRSIVRAPKDVGVDVAIPNRAQIRVMDGPSPTATRILAVGDRDTLALIDRLPTNGWFNVIHVHSGKEGWVNEADVRLAFTKHPLPLPVFSEAYVGRDAAPVLTVINKTDRELSLRIDDSRYTVACGKTLEVSHPGGICKFFASAPRAIPLSGTREWKRGYSYEWTFWIERQILPGVTARLPAAAK